jgi:choline dehydrogenase-like flavoprotein
MADNVYDAVVIGSGISGGWAAKELTEKGLKTIMQEQRAWTSCILRIIQRQTKKVGIITIAGTVRGK